MPCQVVRHRGIAVPRHIAGRRAHHAPVLEQKPRVDARIRHLAEANAEIETLVLKTYRPVRQMQQDFHRGIARDELRHRRRDARATEPERRIHAQQAGRLAAALRDQMLQF